MKTFKVGLKLANDVYFILDITAETFEEASQKWAFITGHNDPLYNKKNNTYFGWPIVEIIDLCKHKKTKPTFK